MFVNVNKQLSIFDAETQNHKKKETQPKVENFFASDIS